VWNLFSINRNLHRCVLTYKNRYMISSTISFLEISYTKYELRNNVVGEVAAFQIWIARVNIWRKKKTGFLVKVYVSEQAGKSRNAFRSLRNRIRPLSENIKSRTSCWRIDLSKVPSGLRLESGRMKYGKIQSCFLYKFAQQYTIF